MEYLYNNFDTKISIGSYCHSKYFLDEYYGNNAFTFFDWGGIPMWGVLKLFENNFDNFFDMSRYEKKLTIKGKKLFPTHKDYYFRVPHYLKDINNELQIKIFIETYKRRLKRMLHQIENSNCILFVRYEEEMENRIIEHKEYNIKSELEYLKDFSKLIKKIYPTKVFQFLFFNRSYENGYDIENKIIFVKVNINNYNFSLAGWKLKKALLNTKK